MLRQDDPNARWLVWANLRSEEQRQQGEGILVVGNAGVQRHVHQTFQQQQARLLGTALGGAPVGAGYLSLLVHGPRGVGKRRYVGLLAERLPHVHICTVDCAKLQSEEAEAVLRDVAREARGRREGGALGAEENSAGEPAAAHAAAAAATAVVLPGVDLLLDPKHNPHRHRAFRSALEATQTEGCFWLATADVEDEAELTDGLRHLFARVPFQLPNPEDRRRLLDLLMAEAESPGPYTQAQVDDLVQLTEGYSAADLRALVRDLGVWGLPSSSSSSSATATSAAAGAKKGTLGIIIAPPPLVVEAEPGLGPGAVGVKNANSGDLALPHNHNPNPPPPADLVSHTRPLHVAAALGRGAHKKRVTFASIVGLEGPKRVLLAVATAVARHGTETLRLLTPVLLDGEPGGGKTLLAVALAHTLNLPLLQFPPHEAFDKYLGEGEKKVHQLFQSAAKLAPCVVFLDEVDTVLAPRQSEDRHGHRVTNAFLTGLNRLQDEGTPVLVVAATNNPDLLDTAGRDRFRTRVHVPLPEAATRRQFITQVHPQVVGQLSPAQIDQLVAAGEGKSMRAVEALLGRLTLAQEQGLPPDQALHVALAGQGEQETRPPKNARGGDCMCGDGEGLPQQLC